MSENTVELLIPKVLNTITKGKKSANPKLIVLMGLPGTGKSYVADYLNRKYGFTILSGENFTFALFGTGKHSADKYILAYNVLRELSRRLIKQGYSIVIDGTNLKFIYRQQIYKDVGLKFKTLLFYLFVDDKIALERTKRRGENYNSLQNIKSSCSVGTFNKFKEQLEEPLAKEKYFKIKSDKNILRKIDLIFKKI